MDHALSTTEKALLTKEMNFGMPPKNINYTNFMLTLELLYRDVNSLEVSNLDKEFIKSRLRDSAFSSYKDTSKTFEKNLPKAEFGHSSLTPYLFARFSGHWRVVGSLVEKKEAKFWTPLIQKYNTV